MVAQNKIWTPASETENLAEAFKKETEFMLKKAALENNCDVEELKFSVNNVGMVNIQRMTEREMKDAELERQQEKQRKKLLRLRGHNA